jgi:hypothetical protein
MNKIRRQCQNWKFGNRKQNTHIGKGRGMENRQLISTVGDGMLNYALNSDKLIKSFKVACALRGLFTPALNIILK